jgi:hypothetical protein
MKLLIEYQHMHPAGLNGKVVEVAAQLDAPDGLIQLGRRRMSVASWEYYYGRLAQSGVEFTLRPMMPMEEAKQTPQR